MLPNGLLSAEPVTDSFLTPIRRTSNKDFEWGGAAIRDNSKGLNHSLWESNYDGISVVLSTGEIMHFIQVGEGVNHHSFAFDQNMNPCVVYNKGDHTYLYWYDPLQSKQVTLKYPVKYEYPQISLDDHRPEFASTSDIILSYIHNAKLCYRQQRDRYQIEYVLSDAKNQKLTQIGMSKNYRFQFRLVFDWRNE